MDAGTLASYATVAVASFTIAAGLAAAAWKLHIRRQERAVDVTVEVAAGFATAQPGGPAVIVTVRNPLAHPVNVTGVAVEVNDGSNRLAVEPWVHRGASLPGEVPPHGLGMMWFDYRQLVSGGLNPVKPVRAQVRLADRSEALWSPPRPLLKAD